MTNKELGNAIRKELKAEGFATKDISVRVAHALYDVSIRIEVKNPLIKLSEIKKIANKYKQVDYCEKTGEILAGGNTYISCQYEHGIFDRVAEIFTDKAESILKLDFGLSGGKVITVVENEEKEINIYKIDNLTWNLLERKKDERIYYNRYYIRSIKDLAVAIWRFENLGTIYA